jgi:hypothetical protein
VKSLDAPTPLHLTPDWIVSGLSRQLHEGGKRGSPRRDPLRANKTISIRQYIARAEQLKKI